MNKWLQVFLFLVVCNCAIESKAQDNVDQLIIDANEKASSGDFKAALDTYNKILLEYPSYSSIIFLYRGNLKFRMNNFNEAIQDYDKSIALDSSRNDAFFYRALSKLELSYYEAALEDLDYLIKKDPSFGDAYVKRGEARIALNRRKEGCDDIQHALELGEERAQESWNRFCK